jgi:hypothetical protein
MGATTNEHRNAYSYLSLRYSLLHFQSRSRSHSHRTCNGCQNCGKLNMLCVRVSNYSTVSIAANIKSLEEALVELRERIGDSVGLLQQMNLPQSQKLAKRLAPCQEHRSALFLDEYSHICFTKISNYFQRCPIKMHLVRQYQGTRNLNMSISMT